MTVMLSLLLSHLLQLWQLMLSLLLLLLPSAAAVVVEEDADEVAHAFDVEADVADDGVGGGGECLYILLLLWPAINTSA